MCRDLREGIEITPEMIDAGLERLFRFHLSDPDELELRRAVAEVFSAMMEARPESRRAD